jgi:enoyl-CoA hydratase
MAVRVERTGPITTVIMDRPEVRNAIDHETAQELQAAFSAFEEDNEAFVAVLCGNNGIFSAGYDLKTVAAGRLAEVYEPEGDGPLGISRMWLNKPVIAAIDGHAVAGGLELALWCDLRVIEEDAVMGVFCRRWGVPLVDGGTVRLPRLIGMSRALDLILTGRPVGAEEALAIGLCHKVVPKGHAREEAQQLAEEIAKFPQICLRADRESVYHQWDYDLAEALKNEGRVGLEPILAESAIGAARFADGLGRSGSFERI